MAKYLKVIERFLLIAGVALLVFCAAAKLHERLLSRAAVRQFEHAKSSAAAPSEASSPPSLSTPTPSFLLWSKQRIQHYENALSQQVAPPLAVLRIDRLHLEAPVLEGTDDMTLNRGLGRIEGTAQFGENGNVGIAGHRDSFFRSLRDIKLGDRIALEVPGKTETYIVDKVEIVDPRNVSVLRPDSKPAVTLVTCYPFYYIGSAPKRYIVHATLAFPGSEPQGHVS